MFQNEPLTDFTVASHREEFSAALSRVDERIRDRKIFACGIVGGKDHLTGEEYQRSDPSDTALLIGSTRFADEKLTAAALEVVSNGSAAWARTDAKTRAGIIHKAGILLSRRRLDLAALIVREAGKPWKEADADVAEAVDFCTYYASEMGRLGEPFRTAEVMGEENIYFYQPRGIAVVIAPWNFPLAIACGMTVAALVTGNATILKPSEQTSLIAFEFAKILLEAGVPQDAFAFLPGRGEVVGRALVMSPLVDLICFTGSKAVGLEIIRNAAELKPGQKSIKRVIAELGGKNAIIVDEDADLDEAVKGAIYSSFGFAGQKCSACSRVIGVGGAYENFLKRFADAAGDILTGKAAEAATLLGPVIDRESQERILNVIAAAEKELSLSYKGTAPSGGYFVPAAIFRDVPSGHSLWREEVFGPVVACAKANDFEEALVLANDCEYALTGGLFSRSPSHIDLAKREFRVGNLYINRGCTGALVCRQPFGGFKMSGVGSKAGGRDYLLQFLEPRVVTENTLRRGFAPETV